LDYFFVGTARAVLHRPLARGQCNEMSNIDLLEGFLDLEPFSKEVKRSPRTVRRWLDQRNGLPYTRFGNRILIHVPTARDWIFGRMRGRNPPRKQRR
jgi:hypothetical protein